MCLSMRHNGEVTKILILHTKVVAFKLFGNLIKNSETSLYISGFSGTFVIFGDIFYSHGWGYASGMSWVEVRVNAKYPTLHRTAPIMKNYLAQNVNSAKIETLFSVKIHICPYKTSSTVPGLSGTS